ncbi:MAG TPA: hypothetical protein VHW66_13915 [Stellaceae bacterium]|nr:hypothetical protein [Stellaceae bacterium]
MKMLEPALALAGAFTLALAAIPARAAENLKFRCTNAASGTSWGVVVDLERRLVDGSPAEISDRAITWRDRESRTYDLDRTTGGMRMRNASSTGGYFLYYTCKPDDPVR